MSITEGKIDVTGVDLEKLLQVAYELSRPQGLGIFSATRGPLDPGTAAEILERGQKDDNHFAISTDYVHGRSMKFKVWKIDGRHYIGNRWYDHSTGQLKDLLEAVQLPARLVEDAREAEERYHTRLKNIALTYLRERGGVVVQNRGLKVRPKPEEELPAEVNDGLPYALYAEPPLVTEKYDYDTGLTTWRLVA